MQDQRLRITVSAVRTSAFTYTVLYVEVAGGPSRFHRQALPQSVVLASCSIAAVLPSSSSSSRAAAAAATAAAAAAGRGSVGSPVGGDNAAHWFGAGSRCCCYKLLLRAAAFREHFSTTPKLGPAAKQIGTYQPAGAAMYSISSHSSSNQLFNHLPFPTHAQPYPSRAEMVAPAGQCKAGSRSSANACLASQGRFARCISSITSSADVLHHGSGDHVSGLLSPADQKHGAFLCDCASDKSAA
eukprot:gene2361-biopygen3912